MRVALVTYSVKPRGGVVHTLFLAEALRRLGTDVTVVALGHPHEGFFRPVDVPTHVIGPPPDASTLEERVFRSVDVLADGLAAIADDFDLFHTQDCISARAAVRVAGLRGLNAVAGLRGLNAVAGLRGLNAVAGPPVLRTVHHVDDFTTPALIDCQRQAILEPDRILVVSEHWRALLRDEYGVESDVVYNGADGRRPLPRQPGPTNNGRFQFLAVGGIEPRKGSVHLIEALGQIPPPRPQLAIVGGHSFQDYAAYREDVLARLGPLGLELGHDVLLLGTVTDAELDRLYATADALVFPSIKEGWGLTVLEAMHAGLPVIATDIPVFREYLTDGHDSLLVPPADSRALAAAMQRMAADPELRRCLAANGRHTAARYTWETTARRHAEIYLGSARVGG